MPDLDTNLTPGDLCLFIKADPTDTGPQPGTNARPSYAIWWLSPDIVLNGGTNLAQAGITNAVQVNFTLKSGCALPQAANNRVRVELWVGNPALTMTPGSNTFQLGGSLVVGPVAGNNLRNFSWTLPTPLPPDSDPQGKGHKCLVARCYPNNMTPDGMTFHQVDDPHVSQRNICIVLCSSPCAQEITTANPNPEKAEPATILAIADLEPRKYVVEALMPALKQIEGFQEIATTPPPPFQLVDFKQVPELGKIEPGKIDPGKIDPRKINVRIFEPKIIDHTKRRIKGRYGRRKYPNFQADFMQEPKQVTTFQFATDMERVKPGMAHIIHLTHIDAEKRVIGGLTLVAIKVEK